MSAPATEELRELERLLVVAVESGESMTRAQVQEELDVSGQEAERMLEVLREHGKAVEVAPGEWRGPMQDEVDRQPSGAEESRVVVTVSDDDAPVAAEASAAGGGFWAAGGGGGAGVRALEGALRPDANVRFSRAVADALDADAMGKIVKAAIDATPGDEEFVFEVTP